MKKIFWYVAAAVSIAAMLTMIGAIPWVWDFGVELTGGDASGEAKGSLSRHGFFAVWVVLGWIILAAGIGSCGSISAIEKAKGGTDEK